MESGAYDWVINVDRGSYPVRRCWILVAPVVLLLEETVSLSLLRELAKKIRPSLIEGWKATLGASWQNGSRHRASLDLIIWTLFGIHWSPTQDKEPI